MTPDQKSKLSARIAAYIAGASGLTTLLMDIPLDPAIPIPWRKMGIQLLIVLLAALMAYWHDLRAYFAPSPNTDSTPPAAKEPEPAAA